MNIWRAAKAGKLEWLQKYTAEHGKAALDEEDKKGETPLIIAVKEQLSEIVAFLLEQGANVNKADEEGLTPLLHASKTGYNEEILDLLLNHKADLNAKDAKGYTALHWAIRLNEEDLVEHLLSRNANVKVKTSEEGFTPLHLATNPRVAEMLLDRQAEINAKDGEGNTPLIGAIRQGNDDVIRLLISSRADFNIQNNAGDSPIHFIAKEGRETLLKFLLHQQKEKQEQEGKVDNLINLDLQNNEGQTPLHVARLNGDEQVAKVLIQYGANQQLRDKNGKLWSELALPPTPSSSSSSSSSSSNASLRGSKKNRSGPPASQLKNRNTTEQELEGVVAWLESLKLSKYRTRFKKGRIDSLKRVAQLTDSDLKQMNIPYPDRLNLLQAISKLPGAKTESSRALKKKGKGESPSGSGQVKTLLVMALVLVLVLIIYFMILK
jgi:ankyrin repeat protein